MVLVIAFRERGITMADGYGTGGQDPQNNSQQDNTYHYNYSYGSGKGTTPSGGYKPPKNSNDWGEWVGIGVLLFILPFPFLKIIGVIWLLSKLSKMSSSEKRRYKQEARNAANRARNTAERFFQQNADAAQRGAEPARQAADAAAHQAADNTRQQAQGSTGGTYHYQYRQAGQSQQKQPPKAEPWEQEAPPDAWNQSERGRKKARRKAGGGTGLIIAGSIVSGIFALGSAAVSMDIISNIAYGHFWPEDLIGLMACLMFLVGGLSMLFSGIGKNRRSERYLNYLAYIGANREVALAPMAASFGVPVSKLCKDLRRMLAQGILPTGYLDLAEGKL
ncbi:MAG: hypothetical protein K2M15_03615, partial [Oscillospiraceae bacterium]|nr:hypothetical protein [Oscillospiraceae bacterium]